ncbi:MAG: hypothetical protein H6799_02910 [Candidatus Nomurabacteria bacterium]|nr:MAG: hypothetical protein H6799_02910 [Candidatus Nomurabacteria bacterium]
MDIAAEDLKKELVDTATNPNYSDLLQDYAELGLEAVTDSKFVDAIPAVKSFVAIVKGSVDIRDRIFLKKFAKFLAEANKLAANEREEWLKRIKVGPNNIEEKLADKLVIMVDSVNDEYKASVIGKLLRAFVSGRISTVEDLFYLTELVESCYTNVLKGLSEGREYSDEVLFRVGLKHSSNQSISEIKKSIDRDAELASRGMTSSAALSPQSADYTSAGMLLINILKSP